MSSDDKGRKTLGDDMPSIGESELEFLLQRVHLAFPHWKGVNDPDFQKDELLYKRATSAKAQDVLSQSSLQRLIEAGEYDEMIGRIDKIGKDNNLLYRAVPRSGDLGILYQEKLDRAAFCRAFYALLYGSGSTPERLERYVDWVASEGLPNKWSFATYFLFMCHPESEIFVKPRTIQWFLTTIGYGNVWSARPNGETYAKITGLAASLRKAFGAYGVRDMMEAQGIIYVAYRFQDWVDEREKESTDTRKTAVPALNETVQEQLAQPFAAIFSNWEEAVWAFEILRQTLDQLGVTGPDDLRFSLSLRTYGGGYSLRLVFGSWLVLGFYVSTSQQGQVGLAMFDESAPDFGAERSYTFAGNGPSISFYMLPLNQFRERLAELLPIFHPTVDHIAKRFANWSASPARRAHRREIAEAVFDHTKLPALLREGIAPLDADDGEPEPDLRPAYSLEECAQQTGFELETLREWLASLERKGQVVLYGPPGTGKTFVAKELAKHLVGGTDGFWEIVQFHPAYAYEDFVQGIRPVERPEGGLAYPIVPGSLMRFCSEASQRTGTCVLIIDEINRANLARVFGELMYLLEYRGEAVPLAAGDRRFGIPHNVRIIGTMNTADRSIALVDHALRRRFAFIALYPQFHVLRQWHANNTGFGVKGLIQVLERLNRAIADANYSVGISFFLLSDPAATLPSVWRTEIEPYLEEYFFDQRSSVDQFRWERVRAEVMGE